MPSMRGTEKPQMSASRTPTVWPRAASAAARLTVTDDLPTPPFPLATARIRVVSGIWVSGARSAACLRARAIRAARSAAVMALVRISTPVTPGRLRRRLVDVAFDLTPQGAGGDGEGDLDADDPVLVDGDVAHHPELDDAGVQLGVDDGLEHAPDLFMSRAVRVHGAILNRPTP